LVSRRNGWQIWFFKDLEVWIGDPAEIKAGKARQKHKDRTARTPQTTAEAEDWKICFSAKLGTEFRKKKIREGNVNCVGIASGWCKGRPPPDPMNQLQARCWPW